MKGKLIYVLCFASLLAGCSGMPTTPKETAVRYYEAVENHDCDWFAKYALAINKQMNRTGSKSEDQIKQSCRQMISGKVKRSLKSVEAKDEKINGDDAKVTAVATFQDNSTKPAEYSLTKIGNIWVVSDDAINEWTK